MEALGILIGAGLAALSPLIPGLRPVTKAVIKGSLAVADAATGIAAATAAGWGGLAHEVTSDRNADAAPEDLNATVPGDLPEDVLADVSVMATSGDVAPAAVAGVTTLPPDQSLVSSPADGMANTNSVALNDNDLTQINGIGPKVAALLHDAGITNLGQLAATDVETLQTILAGAGTRYRALNPESWPEQASQLMQAAG